MAAVPWHRHAIVRRIVMGLLAVLLLLALMVNVLWFASWYLNRHPMTMAGWVSRLVQYPVTIGELRVGWRDLLPVFQFERVAVMGSVSDKPIIVVPQLAVSIDVWSSVRRRQLLAKRLFIRGLHFTVYEPNLKQFDWSQIQFSDIDNTPLKPAILKGILHWALIEPDAEIDDMTIHFRNAIGALVTMRHLTGVLHNQGQQHRFALKGVIHAQHNTPLHFVANLQGDAKDLASLKGQLFLQIKQLPYTDWRRVPAIATYLTRLPAIDAVANLRVWAAYDGQKIASAQAKLTVTQMQYQGSHVAKVSGILAWHPQVVGWRLDADLQANQGALFLPKRYTHPLPFTQVIGQYHWLHTQTRNTLSATHWQGSDGHLTVQGQWQVLQAAQETPTVTARLHYQLDALTRLSDYLPEYLLSVAQQRWGAQAFRSGVLTSGDCQYDGHFYATANLRDVTLQYAPHWPVAVIHTAHLALRQSQLTLLARAVSIDSNVFPEIHGEIPAIDQPVLHLQGASRTSLGQLSTLALHTPMQWAKRFRRVQATGPVSLVLSLRMPLAVNDHQPVFAKGQLQFDRASLALPQWGLALSQLKGALAFYNDRLTAAALSGVSWGAPVTIALHTQIVPPDDAVLHVTASGQLPVAVLRQQYHLPFSQYFSGQASYALALQWHDAASKQQNMAFLTSDLRGIATQHLPAPFAKTATMRMPLSVAVAFSPKHPVFVRLHYGRQVSSALVYHPSFSGLQLYSGDIQVGRKKAMYRQQAGVMLQAKFAQLSLASWLPFLKALLSSKNAGHIDTVLQRIDLYVGKLQWQHHHLTALQLSLAPEGNVWKVTLNNAIVSGFVFAPTNPHHRWEAHFSRLYLPKAQGANHWKQDPRHLPPLTLSVADFHYGTHAMGQLLLDTAKTERGVVINTLRLSSPTAQLQLQGHWYGGATQQSAVTVLHGSLQSTDIGEALRWLSDHPLIEYGEGELYFNVGWQAAPYAFNDATLYGQLQYQLNDGSFVKIGKSSQLALGFGRLLNLLSVTALFRHLKTDFHDLTHKGIWFDHLYGHLQFDHGVAKTRDTTLNGPTVSLTVRGWCNTRTTQCNLMYHVFPKLTSSLPTVIGVLGGPIAGMVSWAADKLLGPALSRVSEHTYRMTGSWKKPTIVKVPTRRSA